MDKEAKVISDFVCAVLPTYNANDDGKITQTENIVVELKIPAKQTEQFSSLGFEVEKLDKTFALITKLAPGWKSTKTSDGWSDHINYKLTNGRQTISVSGKDAFYDPYCYANFS